MRLVLHQLCDKVPDFTLGNPSHCKSLRYTYDNKLSFMLKSSILF